MRKQRIPSLDGVRFLSVFVVMLYHANEFYFLRDELFIPGGVGVMVCFIMSGFLCGYLHGERYHTFSWKDSVSYFRSKLLKFYPAHLITFVITLVLILLQEPVSVRMLLHKAAIAVPNLLLLQSLIPLREINYGFNGVTWYLSALMILYLTTPLFIYLINKTRKRLGLPVIGVLLAVYNAMLLVFPPKILALFPNVGDSFANWILLVCPLKYSGPFFYGIWGGIVYEYRQEQKRHGSAGWGWMLVAPFLGCLTVSTLFIVANKPLDWKILVCCFVIFLAGRKPLSAFMGCKLMHFLSEISFELYMTHQLVIRYVSLLLPPNSTAHTIGFLICLAGSVPVSYYLHNVCVSLGKRIERKLSAT